MSPAVNHHHHLTSRHSLVCILCCCLHWASIRCRWNSDGLVAAANVHHRNLRKLRSGHPWSFLTPYRMDYYSGKLRGGWILIHLFCFFYHGKVNYREIPNLLSLTSLCVMLYRAEKPSLATAMSVWKDRERIPVDEWISGGTLVPQYRPIRGPTVESKNWH